MLSLGLHLQMNGDAGCMQVEKSLRSMSWTEAASKKSMLPIGLGERAAPTLPANRQPRCSQAVAEWSGYVGSQPCSRAPCQSNPNAALIRTLKKLCKQGIFQATCLDIYCG